MQFEFSRLVAGKLGSAVLNMMQMHLTKETTAVTQPYFRSEFCRANFKPRN